MSLKKVAQNQPKDFKFSKENLVVAEKILKKYPEGKKEKCRYAIIIFSSKTKSKLDTTRSYEVHSQIPVNCLY